MAGGGVKGGVAYRESDEFAYRTVKDPVYCYRLHATALHLLGVDHTRLTHHHNGIDIITPGFPTNPGALP